MCVRRFDLSDHSVCIIIAQPVVPYAFQWAIHFHLSSSRSICHCVQFVNALFATHRSKPFKILRRIRKSFKEKQDTIATTAALQQKKSPLNSITEAKSKVLFVELKLICEMVCRRSFDVTVCLCVCMCSARTRMQYAYKALLEIETHFDCE